MIRTLLAFVLLTFPCHAFATTNFVTTGPNPGDNIHIGPHDTNTGSIQSIFIGETGPDPVMYLDDTRVILGRWGMPLFDALDTLAFSSNMQLYYYQKSDVDTIVGSLNYTGIGGLATVAHTGEYADILHLPFIPATFDDLGNGTTNKAFTATLLAKLNGVAIGATANASDGYLLDRANHTGTQATSTILGFSSAASAAAPVQSVAGRAGTVTLTTNDLTDATSVGKAVTTAANAAAARTAIGAGTGDSNVALPIAESDVTNLATDLANRSRIYLGGTLKANAKMIVKTATVASGNAVFYLTADETSTGTALCTNVYLDSRNFQAIDVDAPHTYGTAVLTNSNRTLTVPVKKTTGTFISLLSLTLLGAPAAANGSVISATILCD